MFNSIGTDQRAQNTCARGVIKLTRTSLLLSGSHDKGSFDVFAIVPRNRSGLGRRRLLLAKPIRQRAEHPLRSTGVCDNPSIGNRPPLGADRPYVHKKGKMECMVLYRSSQSPLPCYDRGLGYALNFEQRGIIWRHCTFSKKRFSYRAKKRSNS